MLPTTFESTPSQLPRRDATFAPEPALRAVQELAEQLSGGAHGHAAAQGIVLQVNGRRPVPVPGVVVALLQQLLTPLSRGDGVLLVPVHKELTTQQAADVLGVSRQYLIRLLGEGHIPFSRTGTHRRLRYEDVLAYKEKRDAERRAALDEMAQMTQEAGGYPELD